MDAPRTPSPHTAAGVSVRYARDGDLPRLTEIYHYIATTPITFDTEPHTVEERRSWLDRFSTEGPYRLLVAEESSAVLGFAGTMPFRPRRAYETTVETTVYCSPDATGRGIGTLLYAALFDAIRGEDLRVAIAGVTLPNEASVALHERFGFALVGVMHGVGRKFGRYWDVAWYEKPLG